MENEPAASHSAPQKPRFRTVFGPAAVLTLALSFLLALYGPLELYFTNIREFSFDFFVLFPALCKLFLLLAATGLLAFAFCYALHIRLYDTILVIAAVSFVCTYVQGMFLSGHLPPLDGREIHWNEYLTQDTISILLWLAVGTAAVLLVRPSAYAADVPADYRPQPVPVIHSPGHAHHCGHSK